MPNSLERFFDKASQRIPPPDETTKTQIPKLDLPESAVFDPARRLNSNDWLQPLDERIWQEEVTRRLLTDGRPIPGLNTEERSLLDGGLREIGFEVYAFYKSRRWRTDHPYPGKWGIFYIWPGIIRITELIEETYPGYGPKLSLAIDFLRQHERYHLKFDLWALSTEAALRLSLYEPLKLAFRHHQIHQTEEALANRDAWDWAKQSRIGLKEFAYDFMKLQPGSYSRFDEKRFDLSSELAANLLDLDLSGTGRRDDQALWVANVPSSLLRTSLCPEYIVHTTSLGRWIDPAWRLPEVRQISDSKQVERLVNGKYRSIQPRWEATKRKLMENPGLPGLDFKRWDKKTDQWSVRVDDNFRAHLRPTVAPSPGSWEAQDLGPHKAMGHG